MKLKYWSGLVVIAGLLASLLALQPSVGVASVGLSGSSKSQMNSHQNSRCESLSLEGDAFWDQGDLPAALQSYQNALGCYQNAGDRAGASRTHRLIGIALNDIGLFLEGQGRLADALVVYQQGLSSLQSAGDRAGESSILNNIALVHSAQGNHSEALATFERVLVIRRALGDAVGQVKAYNSMGKIRHGQGQYQPALELYQQALEIAQAVNDPAGQGTALSNIGGIYHVQGRYHEAQDFYQQALVIARRVGAPSIEESILNNIGGIVHDQGRYPEARAYYEQALAIQRRLEDRSGEILTLGNIGEVYRAEGRYDEALEVHLEALAIARRIDDRAGEGRSLNRIGIVHHARGRHVEALELYHQALSIKRSLSDRDGEGSTLGNIGSAYVSQGRYLEAIDFYEQALAIAVEVGDRAGQAPQLAGIGLANRYQGRFREALVFYERALTVAREVGDRRLQGTMINSIGAVYREQGRYGEALVAYQQALAIHQDLGNRPEEGTALNNIGAIHVDQGRHEEAIDFFQRALVIQRDTGNQVGEAEALGNIGAAHQLQGQYDEALEFHQQSLDISRELASLAGEGVTLSNMGAIYRSQGRYGAAFEAYQVALGITRDIGDRPGEGAVLNSLGLVYVNQGRYHDALQTLERALEISREVGNRVGEGTALSNLGLAHVHQGSNREALAFYEDAIDVLESVRAVAGSELGRASFIGQHSGLYSRVVGLYHQLGQDTDAFFTSERGRSRAFLDSLATGQVTLTDNEAADLLGRERAAYVARQTAQDALSLAQALDPPDPTLVETLETQRSAAERAYAAALAAVEAQGSQLAALVPGRSTVLDLLQVQALLDAQTTLVSFYILGTEGSLAFVITRNSFTVVELPEATRDRLEAEISGIRLAFQRSLEAAHPTPLKNLHALLVAPLAEHLRTSRVGIIPHQTLHYVPFAALTNGDTYFGQELVLFVVPSASSLPFIQKNASGGAGGGALVFGNPASNVPDLAPLFHAASEARSVAQLQGAPSYIGADATESRLWSQASGVGVLHLAAHGAYNQANPLYSAIYLAPGSHAGPVSQSGTADGKLEVHEVYGLGLSGTDLVVLSACETNVGALSNGDEVVGLTRAFLFAGGATVVSTLWTVDDAATEAVMVSFYERLGSGMAKGEALQAAQAEVRTDPRWRSPYYWSGFVLSGDVGQTGMVTSPQATSTSPTPTTAVVAPAATSAPTLEPAPETPAGAPSGGFCATSLDPALSASGNANLAFLVGPLAMIAGYKWWRRQRKNLRGIRPNR